MDSFWFSFLAKAKQKRPQNALNHKLNPSKSSMQQITDWMQKMLKLWSYAIIWSSYITWLENDPLRSSFASGSCLHGRSGRNERECFGHQHRASRFGRSARPHVNEIPYLNKAEAFVSAAFRPKRAHINALLDWKLRFKERLFKDLLARILE